MSAAFHETTGLPTRPSARVRPFATLLHGRIAALMRRLQSGSLTLVLPDGQVVRHEASSPGAEASIVLYRWRPLLQLAWRGDLGFAESYMNGDWSTPDLRAVLRLGAENLQGMKSKLAGTGLSRWWARRAHRARANTLSGSRRNIEAHYDLGNDFYALWLDAGMSYSSALYRAPGQTLEAAQDDRQDRIIEMLAASPGMAVLEIGCGWGGLMQRLAEAGTVVTGLTLSPSQASYAMDRLAQAGLAGRAAVRLEDYRQATGQYQRVVSIEMLEAVGREYWPLFFQTLRCRLAPGGVAVLQVITIDEARFEAYAATPDFIQAHVFPGGMLPTRQILAEQIAAVGLCLEPPLLFGQSYAETLLDWTGRFEQAWPMLGEMGFDAVFRRKWQYYLAYCEAGFRSGMLDVGLYRITRPGDAR